MYVCIYIPVVMAVRSSLLYRFPPFYARNWWEKLVRYSDLEIFRRGVGLSFFSSMVPTQKLVRETGEIFGLRNFSKGCWT